MTTCATCGTRFTPSAIGRPRVFCSDDCRAEMRRRRDRVHQLEQELVGLRREYVVPGLVARQRAFIRSAERRLADARELLPEAER